MRLLYVVWRVCSVQRLVCRLFHSTLHNACAFTACGCHTADAAVCVCECSYKNLARDVKPGSAILCADGSIVLEVISTDAAAGTVRARCKNTAMLGERKNVNLPGM